MPRDHIAEQEVHGFAEMPDPGIRCWAESLDAFLETVAGQQWLAELDELAATEDERHGRSVWVGRNW